MYEQFDTEHKRGSSHGRTRIFRLAYPEPHWVELAAGGARRLARRRARGGAGPARACTGSSSSARASRRARRPCSRRAASSTDCSTSGASRARVELPEGWIALWQPDAGVGPRRRGATRVPRACAAKRGDAAPGRVARRRRCRRRGRHGRCLDHEARPRPAASASRARRSRTSARDGAPMPSVVELDAASRRHAMYALHDPRYGVKAGAHQVGHVADPDVGGSRRPATRRAHRRVGARRVCPDVDPEPVAAETCLYTTTADESFILERRGRVVDRLGVLGSRLQVRARRRTAAGRSSARLGFARDAVLSAPRRRSAQAAHRCSARTGRSSPKR